MRCVCRGVQEDGGFGDQKEAGGRRLCAHGRRGLKGREKGWVEDGDLQAGKE